MNLKKNQVVETDIIDITNLGFGVGKVGGEVIFISGAVTGDRVRTRIIKLSSSYAIGRLEEILVSSPNRVDDRCHITPCKSCAYKAVSYEHEMAIKEENVRAAFKKCGLDGIRIAPLVPSPKTCGYRNKAQYPVALSPSGEYLIGFFAPKSHRVTEAAACPLAPKPFSDILELLRGFFAKHKISVYNEEDGKGLLRHIYLRRGEVSGEVLVTLVLSGNSIPCADELCKLLTNAHPEIVGILLNENRKSTNVILGEKYITLFGRDHIYDTLAGVRLKITAPSFYQVNHDCAELLYAKARELAAPTKEDMLLDLYCGAGSIGLSMARECRELVGIEIVDSAVECARLNAEANGITNASFYTGDAADSERLLENAEELRGEKLRPDIVILDPPRQGSDETLLRFIASLAPKRIVYISCNPQTLARDLKALLPLGYEAGEVTPVDMFPGTGHVESVVCLTRRLDN